MAVARYDEVLDKAIGTDATVIPRYTIKNSSGEVIAENVSLELVNPVIQAGTPINRIALNEMLAGSGVTSGTSGAFDLNQENFSLADGATVRCRLNTAATAGSTLNVQSTGDKPILRYDGEPTDFEIVAGAWITLIYSSALDGWILQGWSTKTVQRTEIITASQPWAVPAGVTSVFVILVGGGGGGGAGSNDRYDDFYGSGGGGGSGEIKRQMVSVTPGQSIFVTIGKGGSGGALSGSLGNNGGNGGASSFGTLLSCSGGSGGGGGYGGSVTSGYGGSGGDGGSGGGGGSGANGGDGGNGQFGGGGGAGAPRAGGGNSGDGGNGGTYGGGGGTGDPSGGTGGSGGQYGGRGGSSSAAATAGTNTIGVVDDYPGDGAAGTREEEFGYYCGYPGGGGYGGRGGNTDNRGGAGGGGYGANGGNCDGYDGTGGGGYGANGKNPPSSGGGGTGGGGYGSGNYGCGGNGGTGSKSGLMNSEAGEDGNDGICVLMYTESVA